MNSSKTLLIVADSEHDADMLYAVGMFVPDPFIYLRVRGIHHVVMSDLEIDRARQQAPHCRVLSLSHYQDKLRKLGVPKPAMADVIQYLMREKRARSAVVPGNFPLGLATELQKRRVRIAPARAGIFPERERKSPVEVKKISEALRMAESGMSEGIRVLREAKIGEGRRLTWQGRPLTSEKLRTLIDTAILQKGGLANHTIVAGGNQGCDPHESGHGPLRANEPIILDIFPRSQKTGFFGDITRTVVCGRASDAVRNLYESVRAAQELAFRKVRKGVVTMEIHKSVQDLFKQQGHPTGKRAGRMEGFFHGTGHGLGLEIHEAPRIGSSSNCVLETGNVVTVEPGLYYPGVGGVRLEDVVEVTEGASRNLTHFEKILEL
jgi:Xaa-Pro aminopeptidase